ncbi:GTP-binding protein [Candidatus Tremblaya phenacola]|uniref:Translation initiation factor IF-2 n=1 Tax=Candidatus Tremblayella phenacoccinincola TaxID=1010676 RepID=A0A2G0V702_9PROT|nr:GTP-binding protein [Candidatus Tremblaya phenacola]PHN16246.1 Translation initiation factor IF-2 [Candidatus Tremblaya phenacola]
MENINEYLTRLGKRALVVAIVGHVNHGKTTLIDCIRNDEASSYEVGGITQDIQPYSSITAPVGKLVFIDTPGHETFELTRSYGINLADIVVILIAVEDGVTEECKKILANVKAIGKPSIIGVNKIDKCSNVKTIYSTLDNKDEAKLVYLSAKNGSGVSNLMSSIHAKSRRTKLSHNLKVLVNIPARGTVINSVVTSTMGICTSILVQAGILRIGDIVLLNSDYGRVRLAYDEHNNRIERVSLATPSSIYGLTAPSKPGVKFIVVPTEQTAKELATQRNYILNSPEEPERKPIPSPSVTASPSVNDIFRYIVKARTYGMIEAVIHTINNVPNNMPARVVHKSVGLVFESDLGMATIYGAVIITLGIKPNPRILKLSKERNVIINYYRTIYELSDGIRSFGTQSNPECRNKSQSKAIVKRVFNVSGNEVILGCIVEAGVMKRSKRSIVSRNGKEIGICEVRTLKLFKTPVDEVKRGSECGALVVLTKTQEIFIGDMVETFF